MTRGTFYAITEKLIIGTIEFNGDMYPEGHGNDVMNSLEEVKNVSDFNNMVNEFNSENHNYEMHKLLYPEKRSFYMRKDTVSMTDDNYYEKFFSDWTFWKNLSKNIVTIKTRDKKSITLNPGEQVAISFGYFEDNYKKVVKEKETV